jgi:hypothetical protein
MLPKEYGSGSSTCHRRFQQWIVSSDVFQKLWIKLLERYDELKGIRWKWQSLDSISIKALLGGDLTGANPTDRAKLGTNKASYTHRSKWYSIIYYNYICKYT